MSPLFSTKRFGTEDAALYQDVFVNQWALAVGAQLTRGKTKYRLGYSWNSNPTNHNVGSSFDGIPVSRDQLQFYQASILPFVNQSRITGGIGRQDFLIPGMDLDLFAGGMLTASDNFGPHNSAVLAIYYIGMGMTWRYDACKQTSMLRNSWSVGVFEPATGLACSAHCGEQPGPAAEIGLRFPIAVL